MSADPLKPSAALLIKLGSLVVHLEELNAPRRENQRDKSPMGDATARVADLNALQTLRDDSEVKEWFAQMNKMAFLPVKTVRRAWSLSRAEQDAASMKVCQECFSGCHSQCIGQGCDCRCWNDEDFLKDVSDDEGEDGRVEEYR